MKMANNSITEQMVVEHEMLKSIMDGLRKAIGLKPDGDTFARKLHTVHFIALSLQRHLDHLLTLEECDGYMDAVVNLSPQLGRRVDALRQEHNQFRKASLQVVHGLETVAPTDQTTFRNVCDEALAFLKKLDDHTRKEVDIVHEAIARDSGGEG
jgi:hemerythrin-like domain-containing protein